MGSCKKKSMNFCFIQKNCIFFINHKCIIEYNGCFYVDYKIGEITINTMIFSRRELTIGLKMEY